MKRVTWTIDLDEDTAEAAAVVALAIMRDQESAATDRTRFTLSLVFTKYLLCVCIFND